MNKLKNHKPKALTDSELKHIFGGGLWIGIIGSLAFHVAKEAYNDWEAHVEAFKKGNSS